MEDASVAMFVLFIVVGYLFTFVLGLCLAVPVTLMIAKEKIENSHAYVIDTLLALVALAFMPLLALILTGKSFFLLFAAMCVMALISLGVGDALSRSIGSYRVPWYCRAIWFEIEVRVSHFWLSVSASVLARGVIFLYPFVVGYGYFFGSYSSSQWAYYFLQVTLLMVFVVPWLAEYPKTILALSNKNLMTYGRSRLMINVLASSISTFLIISFMLWSLGMQGATIELFSGYIVLSSSILIGFFLYFILCCVIPYLLGQRRSAQWRAELAARRQNILDRCQAALRCEDKTQVLAALQDIQTLCTAEEELFAGDPALDLANSVLKSEDKEQYIYKIAITESRPRDPRFRHMAFCSRARQVIQQLEDNIYYQNDKSAIKRFIDEAQKGLAAAQPVFIDNTSPWLAMVVSAMIGAGLSMAASTVGHDIAAMYGAAA